MTNLPRLAVVTGAGGGLGRAFCVQLAAAGWHVMAADVDEAGGRETVALANRGPTNAGGAEFVRLDVTDREAWRQLTDRIAADIARGALPSLGLLVNNAGVCAAAETIGTSAPTGESDAWRRLMEVHYFGALTGCQVLGPLLSEAARSTNGGSPPAIINVASIFGLISAPALGAYSASKAAVVALSEALHAELKLAGMHVTVVAPGFFRSGLLERGDFSSEKHRVEAERRSNAARFTADGVARAALAASKRGQLYCVLGTRARWLWRIKRFAPRMFARLMARRYRRTFGND